MVSGASLIIPLASSADETIEIFVSELPTISSDEIVSALQNEKANPSLYLDFALAYKKIGDLDSYRDILEAGVDVPVPHCDVSDVAGMEVKTSKMRIFCALATTKVAEAAQMSKSQGVDSDITKLKVDELYAEANDLFDLSDRINQFWPITWCCKGVMFLQKFELDGSADSQKTLDRARYYFMAAKKEGDSLPCHLGLGAVNYLDGKYKDSAGNYARAISLFPEESGAPARVALGLACYKLGQIDRAKACFDRAIEMDAGLTEGVVGRAVLDLAESDDTTDEGRARVENAIKMIVTSPLHDNNNAMVKNHLANHFFYVYTAIPGTVALLENSNGTVFKCSQSMDLRQGDRIRIGLDFETSVEAKSGDEITVLKPFIPKQTDPSNLTVYKHDFDRVLNFAKAGFHATKVAAVRAESCWLMGRVYQVQGEYENAEKFYHQAVKLDSSFSPALFSYSEILVRKKDYFAAVECLEKVLKTIPNSPDTLSLLGFILAKDANKRPKALNYLQRAIELNPRDPTIHLMYATVLKGNVVDFARSLEAYGKSMGLDGSGVNPTTYNNVGVLNAWKSDFDEAEEKYNAAIKHLTGIKLEGPEALGTITKILESGKDHAVTIVFNLARLYEEKKEYEKAANIQKTIIKSLPAYTGSYVRLATIARDMGAMKQCAEWLKQALEVSTDNTELLSMIGHFWIEDGEYEMGQKIYERLLDEGQSFMLPYAQVSLGNIYFANVTAGGERANKLVEYATLFYKKALKADPSNVYAASGLGCVLAEKGEVEKAKVVFQRVRECSNDANPSIFLNLGHVLLALGQHRTGQGRFREGFREGLKEGFRWCCCNGF